MSTLIEINDNYEKERLELITDKFHKADEKIYIQEKKFKKYCKDIKEFLAKQIKKEEEDEKKDEKK